MHVHERAGEQEIERGEERKYTCACALLKELACTRASPRSESEISESEGYREG